ncbi:HET-domain-containing protein [Stipitochalara longipes BDJ]|nr:HET-domain-containing protein [Stipitochalara longipes BDJ]
MTPSLVLCTKGIVLVQSTTQLQSFESTAPMQPERRTRANYRKCQKRKRDISPHTTYSYRQRFNFRDKNYEYTSLKTATCIRVLELQPGEKWEPVKCQLFCVEREQAPQFEALSYVWGDRAKDVWIGCGNGKLRVPIDLRDALKRLRDPIKSKPLWADAICINQLDKQERGHQVKNMGLIFAKAQRVLVWLGSDSFDDFDEFNDPANAGPFAALKEKGLGPNLQLRPEDLDHNRDHAWTSFAKLLCHPWFSRLWVIQEVGKCKSALALFGENEMDFNDIMILAARLSSERLLVDRFGVNLRLHPFSVFPTKFQEVIDGPHHVNLDFLEVLQDTRTQQATDEKDYVYALLGHPSAIIHGKLIVEPDYNKSAPDLFFEIATKLIQETNSLRVLSAVRHHTEKDLEDEKPSWVPTWARENDTMAFGTDQSGILCRYDAGAGQTISWNLLAAQKVLRIRGFIFDVVDQYTRTVEYSGEYGQLTSSAQSWPIHAVMGFTSRSKYPVLDRLSELAQIFAAGFRSGYLLKGKHLQKLLADFAAFRLYLIKQTSRQGGILEDDMAPEGLAALYAAAENGDVDAFLREVGHQAFGRNFFSTRGGMLGLGPRILRGGDLCCILFGGSVPFILRPVGSQYRTRGGPNSAPQGPLTRVTGGAGTATVTIS